MQLELMFSQIPKIIFSKNLFLYGFIKYIDNNFTSSFKNQKSIIKYYFFNNEIIILQKNKKQRKMFIFTTKSRHIALKYATVNII